ncbi:MAG: bifunctional 2-keto-4-hydroxyglutarate aldolase/2-keto-3-deoxy-6-phosphogluconate aldolase, partial [Oscillospiraceae bacterium]
MEKEKVLTKMTDAGLVAVVRANTADDAFRITDACLEGGCPSIELTFTVPGAHKVIEALANKYTNGEILLGAGTVLDSETARIAILSGASYIVSPGFNAEAAKLCARYRLPYMPGCMTITEVLTA